MHTKTTLAREGGRYGRINNIFNSSVNLGHHIDESKIKKYEMIDDNGKVVKVQFSKKASILVPCHVA